MEFQNILKNRLALYKYSNAVADWNCLGIEFSDCFCIASFGFDDGQYYFDFGF